MADERRIRDLLDDLLESGRTPDDVCRDAPELLPILRVRWERVRQIDRQLEELFPADEPTRPDSGIRVSPGGTVLPSIAGYRVETVLGSGGMGIVFRAHDLHLNRPVAIKMLRSGTFASPRERALFQREAEAVAALRHPNIVPVFGIGTLGGQPYFTMEFLEGGTLAGRIARELPSISQSAGTVATLAMAVQYAHQSGIIHRDLKPANVLLTAGGIPMISDFGLARSLDDPAQTTLTGSHIGTPSYMAPEQARGEKRLVGPASDIYSLGAILYELLTRRPPFEGTTSDETIRKVLDEDPPAPSEFVRVPVDLETICLKCLQKNPARRYASAQDLADDLHRFLDGRPVVARPVGPIVRLAKRIRRRPILATMTVTLLGLTFLIVSFAFWVKHEQRLQQKELRQREGLFREKFERAIQKLYESARGEQWSAVDSELLEAAEFFRFFESAELKSRLDRVRAEVAFARELERIRHLGGSSLLGVFAVPASSYMSLAGEYETAFAGSPIVCGMEGDPKSIAGEIRDSPFRGQIVVALDNWAYADYQLGRHPKSCRFLEIAKASDSSSEWSNRFRDASWSDRGALLKLAEDATAADPPAHLLAILGLLLKSHDERTHQLRLVREALDRRPSDLWLNWEIANVLGSQNRHAESVVFMRVAIALQPDNAWMLSRLGCALSLSGDSESAEGALRKAIRLVPTNPSFRHNLAMALLRSGRTREAIDEAQRSKDTFLESPLAHHSFAVTLTTAGRYAESIPVFKRAIELRPAEPLARCHYAMALRNLDRSDEAAMQYREVLKADPDNVTARHGLSSTCHALSQFREGETECRWLIRHFEAARKSAPLELAGGIDSRELDARVLLVDVLLCQGRFRDSADAANGLRELPIDAERNSAVLRQRSFAIDLAGFERDIDAIVLGKSVDVDDPRLPKLAEWMYRHRRFAKRAVQLYADYFQDHPERESAAPGTHRFQAARAAFIASCGFGEDATQRTADERVVLSLQSLAWLKAEFHHWEQGSDPKKPFDQSPMARTMRTWLQDRFFKCVLDAPGMPLLPKPVHSEWREFWANVQSAAMRDPGWALERAREHTARREWAKAAALDRQLHEHAPDFDGEKWFERAALEILCGSLPAYRTLCTTMLAGAPTSLKFRPYLAARTWTLQANPEIDPSSLLRAAEQELKANAATFWSLTEQGALRVRTNRARESLAYFRRSLAAEPQPGAAVLNWLWLAIAYHELGQPAEGKLWLTKATDWLDSLGDRMPSHANALQLHPHNWLEAHILRREADSRLR